MKTTKRTNRKPLSLDTETLKRIDAGVLDNVRGGMGADGGQAEAAPGGLGLELTELRHSCNPACVAA